MTGFGIPVGPTSPRIPSGPTSSFSASEFSPELYPAVAPPSNTEKAEPLVPRNDFGTMQTKDSFLKFKFQILTPDKRTSASGYLSDTDYTVRRLAPYSLIFHVNPSNFDRSFKKTVDREQTRGGWVEFHGGDELDTINVSGVTSAFVDSGGRLVDISQGRYKSEGWKEYNEFVNLFRNNGSRFDLRGQIYQVGQVVLSYDTGIYLGLFESLNITESADKPFSYDYDFSFVVESTLYRFKRPIASSHLRYGVSK